MKTIAQQLNITDFPFTINDKNGNEIYLERRNEYWVKREYDSSGNEIYYENSQGLILDNRPKQSCEGKIVEIDEDADFEDGELCRNGKPIAKCNCC